MEGIPDTINLDFKPIIMDENINLSTKQKKDKQTENMLKIREIYTTLYNKNLDSIFEKEMTESSQEDEDEGEDKFTITDLIDDYYNKLISQNDPFIMTNFQFN